MRNCNRPFIPANDYNEINDITILVRWNEWPVRFAHNYTALFRRILGYFRRLVCGISLTFSHIPPCFHANPPDFPRLFEPHENIDQKLN